MKNKQSKPAYKWLIALALAAILLAGLYVLTSSDDQPADTLPEAKQQDSSFEQQAVDQQAEKPPTGGGTTGSETQESQHNDEQKAEITNIYQQDNGDLVIQTRLTNIYSGECQLSITINEQTITKSATILFQPEFSTCTGFTIPEGELPSPGNAKVKITVVQDDTEITHTQTEYEVTK